MEIHEEYRPTALGLGDITESEANPHVEMPEDSAELVAFLKEKLLASLERMEAHGQLIGFALVGIISKPDGSTGVGVGTSVPPDCWSAVFDAIATTHRSYMESLIDEQPGPNSAARQGKE